MSKFVTTERRLVLRIQEYWNFLRQDRAFPRISDIDPVALGDDWCDCFVMDPSIFPQDPTFLFVGPRLLESARLPEDWAKSTTRLVHDCPEGSMLARSVQFVGHVIRNRTPVSVSEVFEENGDEVRLRGTLFPLSSNGEDVDAVLGVANCARLEDLRLKKQPAA